MAKHFPARIVGSVLVSIYAISLVLIFLNIWEVLPHWLADRISTNYFDAISLVFTALLIVEVITLIQSLARSVTTSLLKQFELLSLILLRDAFKAFGRFHQPLDWSQDLDAIMYMVADSFGALVIFLIIVLVSRMARHPQITSSMDDQERFVKVKKSVALLLTVAFVVFGIDHLGIYYLTQAGTDFFRDFLYGAYFYRYTSGVGIAALLYGLPGCIPQYGICPGYGFYKAGSHGTALCQRSIRHSSIPFCTRPGLFL